MDNIGARRPQAVTTDHWRKLARTVGLRANTVVDTVTTVAAGVAERVDTAWQTLDDDQGRRLREIALRNTGKLLAGKD